MAKQRDASTIDALVSNLRHQISYARDVVANERYYQENRTRLANDIAEWTAKLERLDDIHANGAEYIRTWQDQIQELQRERKLLDPKIQSEKEKLQKQIANSGLTREELMELLK